MECPICKHYAGRLKFVNGVWGCLKCMAGVDRPHGKTRDLRPFNSRIYVGSEVYGPNYHKNENLIADTQSAMLGGSGRGLKG